MVRFVMMAGALLLAAVRAASAAPLCVGDCDGMGAVTIEELVRAATITVSGASLQVCANANADGDNVVTPDELVAAADNALLGCPSYTGEYYATLSLDAGRTATLELTASGDGTASGTLTIYPAAGGSALSGLLGGAAATPSARAVVSGTINLETGAFALAGTYQDEHGQTISIDISGELPLRIGGAGTINLLMNSVAYPGLIRNGTLPPAPTPTSTSAPATATRTNAPATPTGTGMPSTPTATATPTPPANTPPPTTGNRPTPPAGCPGGGYAVATFSDATGTNANQPLTGSLEFFQVDGTIVGQPAMNNFGGGANHCLGGGSTIRRFQWRMLKMMGQVPVGQPISLDNTGHTILEQYYLDYLETPISNPLGTVGWRAKGGTFTIDSIEGHTVRFHVTDALMMPEPSFSYLSPATGSFKVNMTGTIDNVTIVVL